MAGGVQPSQRQPELSAELPSQAPSYGTTQQAPAAAYPQAPSPQSPVSYSSAPSTSGMQTYLPQQTQAYSQEIQAPTQSYSNVESQQSNLASDEYLANVSAESLEVLNHFGAEAPALLNRYACTVEDALISSRPSRPPSRSPRLKSLSPTWRQPRVSSPQLQKTMRLITR